MQKFLIVMLGAGFGGGFRYLVANFVQKATNPFFPFGTLAVNFLGSFILGILIFAFDDKELLSANMKLLIGVGFCGGFTTFSTFSFETFSLIKNTQFLLAGVNIFANILTTLFAVYLAHIITK